MPTALPTLLRHPAARRALAWTLGATALTFAALCGAWMMRAAWVATGFYAKQLCSSVFVSGRDPADTARRDLAVMWPGIVFQRVAWSVDPAGRAEASWLGLVSREARHRPGYGCTLVTAERPGFAPVSRAHARVENPSSAVRRAAVGPAPAAALPALEAVLDEAFLAGRTRAVVVMQHGRIVAERYAPGFDAATRFGGWSLTKSVFNAVTGALVARGALDVHEPVRIAAWREPGDPRAAIAYDDLLRMSSGLAFTERYEDPFSDVARMLFSERAAGTFAASRPLVAAPGAQWRYTSGTTNILAEALRAHVPAGLRYHELPWRLVFEPLGMSSAVVELDESGTFIGSSYMLATARDWATFGALYAADGVWDGRRLLPEGWVAYSRTPVPASAGRYGAHFWLYDAEERGKARAATAYPIPEDAFFAGGFAGQRITIVPSLGLSIVRLGYDVGGAAFDNAAFAARVLAALGAGTGS